jgi:hypothetical protein
MMKPLETFVQELPELCHTNNAITIVGRYCLNPDYVFRNIIIHDSIHYITEYGFDNDSELEVAKIEMVYDIGAYSYRLADRAYHELKGIPLQDPSILKICTLDKILETADLLEDHIRKYHL